MATAEGVSVVVPHYGPAERTLAIVAALRAQEVDLPLQLVVVDDSSPHRFPITDGIEVVRRPRNGGYGAAVNTGASTARYDRLLVVNSDLHVGPTFIGDLVEAAAPWWPAVVGPRLIRPDGASEWGARHFPRAGHHVVEWLTPLARWRDHRRLHEAVGHDTRAVAGEVLPVDWVVGAALLLPTELFRAVGGFDEQYFMYSEEVDLQRRLRERGVPSIFAGTVTAAHAGGASSDPTARRQWVVDSRFRFADLWGGRRRLAAGLTVATAVNAVVNSARRVAGRDVRPLVTAREELRLIRHGAGQVTQDRSGPR
jgi:N-acetylglucosaminyl-diphospho-decaprenol L-rhamnosyltransferase